MLCFALRLLLLFGGLLSVVGIRETAAEEVLKAAARSVGAKVPKKKATGFPQRWLSALSGEQLDGVEKSLRAALDTVATQRRQRAALPEELPEKLSNEVLALLGAGKRQLQEPRRARKSFKAALAKLRGAAVNASSHVLLALCHVLLGFALGRLRLHASSARHHDLAHGTATAALARERRLSTEPGAVTTGREEGDPVHCATGRLQGCARAAWERVRAVVLPQLEGACAAGECAAEASANVSPHPSIDIFRLPGLLQSLRGTGLALSSLDGGAGSGRGYAPALRRLTDKYIAAVRRLPRGRTWCFDTSGSAAMGSIDALHAAGKLTIGWAALTTAAGDLRCSHELQPTQRLSFDKQLTDITRAANVSSALKLSSSVLVPPGFSPVVDNLVAQLDERLGLGSFFPKMVQLLRYGAGQEYDEHTDCDPFLAIEGMGRVFGSAHEAAAARLPTRAATALVYLNGGNDEALEGGETVFPLLNVSIAPREGLAVLFNNLEPRGFCNPRSMHRAQSPRRGVKHVLQRWYFDGPSPTRRERTTDHVLCDRSGSCREYVHAVPPATTSTITVPGWRKAELREAQLGAMERAFRELLCPPRSAAACDDVVLVAFVDVAVGCAVDVEFRWQLGGSEAQHAALATALVNINGDTLMARYSELLAKDE